MDRKAWIVLALCGVLLAVNIHYSKKNREALAAKQAAELAEEVKKSGDGKTGGGEPVAGNPGEAPDDPAPVEERAEEQIVELKTKEVAYAFTTHGGGIKYAEFAGQFAVGEKEKLVRLNRFGTHPVGAITTGVDEFLDLVFVHQEEKKTDRSVEFLGKTKDGLYIRKKWTLVDDSEPGSGYRLKFELTFENHSQQNVDLEDYGLFTGSAARLWEGEWEQHTGIYYLRGDKLKFKTVKWFKNGKRGPYQKDAPAMGYAGVGNQFFASIVAPKKPYDGEVWSEQSSAPLTEAGGGGAAATVRVAMSLPEETLATGGDKEVIEFEVFMGPKRNSMLRKIGMERGRVMNYGNWLSVVSRPLNKLLNVLHTYIFDPISKQWGWGFSIVALTILIRGAMWPLQNKSTRAMKRMAKLQPEVKALKEKYPDDPQKMNQEMMAMYREYGVNPIGGCLPLVVQIPIFFGFYRMLMYAVELRQQKFLWVEDLSQPDTLFHLPFSLPFLGSGVNLLPIVMAGTMVLQMALTPKTGDKMQRRLFMLMPLIFFFFCYNFASALALYWTTSNIFAIVQTLITQRLPEPELKKKKKGGKGFFSRMQERAEAAQKMQKARRAEAMGNPQKKPKKRPPRTGG